MPVQTKVDINSASREELIAIDGIGETMADAIIRYRDKNGPFKNVDDIDNVPGIGESRLEYIKESLSASGRSSRLGSHAASRSSSSSRSQASPAKSQSSAQPSSSRSHGHEKSGSHGGSHR